jgi:hypothetical protein
LAAVDAVIAFGSDATMTSLREKTPPATPFFGYGHSISIGLTIGGDWELDATARGFACDMLMYAQQGCLSPQVIFTVGAQYTPVTLGKELPGYLNEMVASLDVLPIDDFATATLIRQEQAMMEFRGFRLTADPALRWTVAYTTVSQPLTALTGSARILQVIPLYSEEDGKAFGKSLGPFRGHVSSVGIAGDIPDELRETLYREGVSRICRPGEMQMPPLDWPNGNFDLLAELLVTQGKDR